jgi:hypothetical protein
VIGVFYAARSTAGEGALNPFYGLGATAFSDAFLMVSVSLVVSIAAAFWVQGRGG